MHSRAAKKWSTGTRGKAVLAWVRSSPFGRRRPSRWALSPGSSRPPSRTASAAPGTCRWRKRCSCSLRRPDLAVRPRLRPRVVRTAEPPLVDGPRGALAPFPRSPRSGRVGGRLWLILIPLIVVFALEECSRRLARRRTATSPTFLASDGGQSFLTATGVGSASSRPAVLQHRARGGAALSWVPSTADEPRLRTRRLGCERRPLRRLPHARAVDDAGNAPGTRSPSPIRPSAIRAPGSGSPCTARKACSSQSSSSPSSCDHRARLDTGGDSPRPA